MQITAVGSEYEHSERKGESNQKKETKFNSTSAISFGAKGGNGFHNL